MSNLYYVLLRAVYTFLYKIQHPLWVFLQINHHPCFDMVNIHSPYTVLCDLQMNMTKCV